MFNDADDFTKLGRDFVEVVLNLVIGKHSGLPLNFNLCLFLQT